MATQAASDKSYIVPLGPLYLEFIFVTDVTDGDTVTSKLANPQFVTAWALNDTTSTGTATATTATFSGVTDDARAEGGSKAIEINVPAALDGAASVCVVVFGNASVK